MNSDGVTRRTLLAGAATIAAVSGARVTSDPLDWTLTEASQALTKGTVSSEELTKLCLARIHKLDPSLNAFITLTEESALQQARECDRQRKAGGLSSHLYGVPIALEGQYRHRRNQDHCGGRLFSRTACQPKTPK